MLKVSVFVLFCTGLAAAQTAPAPAAGATTPADHKITAPVENPAQKAAPTVSAADLPPTTPVITLQGFCPDAPAKTDTNSPACKTVITKAAFEKLIDTLNPKMPPAARQSVASDYSKMLVLSNEAKKKGLEDSQHFKDFMAFMKVQVAAQEMIRQMQDKAKPSEAEVQKYYQDNSSKYEEISLKRVFIPRNSPNAKPEDKKPTDDDLKAEGTKVREQLAAGGDFDKVQKDLYTAKGYNTAPPPTSIPPWRHDSVPPTQAALFNLKQGELSEVMVEPAGAYVYRLEEKKVTPLEMMKGEIESQLGNQKMKTEMEALTSSVKPELNEAYFRSFGGPANAIGPASAAPHRPTPTMVPRPVAPKSATPKAAPPAQ